MIGRSALVGAVIVGVGVSAACVGDDPSSNGAAVPDGGSATDAPSATDSGGVEDGGGADGADGGATRRCDLQKPFVAKGAIAGIADLGIPDLSMDEPELEAIVAIYRTDAGAHGLFETKRSLVTDPFQTPVELTALNVGQARGGMVSPNRQTIVFFSGRDGVHLRLFTSKRTGTTGAFPAPTKQIVTPLESFDVAHPEWIDDGRIVFGVIDESVPTKNKLYRATWNGTSIVTPVEITELTPYQPTRPSITTGETIIVFQSKLTGTSRIMEARRGTGVQFGAAVEIDALRNTVGEYPLYLSRNGCRLAYAIMSDPKVYWAERGP